MQKKSSSKSAFSIPRLLLSLTLCLSGVTLAILCFASTPSSGTLTDVSGPVTYTAGPFTQPNPSPLGAGQLDTGPRCDSTLFLCDTYSLTVTLPAGYSAMHPSAAIKVTMSWTDAATGKSDYDLYAYKLPRNDCASTTGTPSPDCSQTDGAESADYQSASSSNPEVATISPQDGTTVYTIHIVPYTPTGETIHVTAQLFPGAPGTVSNPNFGGPDATVPNAPRFLNFYAPSGTSAESGSGEFNIGYNPNTHRIMTMNIGPIWRLTLPEYLAQAKPECCEAFWEDKDNATTNTGLDPILWTDQKSGRTFSSNSTAGANVVYGYSDNDGDSWIPIGAALPNGGADHETIGTGNYPQGLTILDTPLNQGHAVYYCSQDIVGPAACYRSDTLGASYGASTFAYTGQGPQGCGGLHGHLHVAPDGTVWLPVNQCSGKQGGVFSTDGGTTWTEFVVPSNLAGGSPQTGISQSQGADPSIAIDANSRIYYSYVNDEANGNEGHPRVATGVLTGCTVNPVTQIRSGCTISWGPDIDIGSAEGVVNAAEIEAVGGDPGRAAVGFLGTDRTGDYQSGSFPGRWYAFIGVTYDNGATWKTVNATPNDPVQNMTGVWQQGGSGQNGDRNLLDFNEITIGDKGQVLYGYSDGCVTSGCINGTAGNDKTAFMRVARQSGGKTLYAAYDVNEPVAPKAPCLSGTRDTFGSDLTWKVPDNGGSDITKYQIFRGTSPGNEVLIATTGTVKPEYVDTTADPNVPIYYYEVKAVNTPSGTDVIGPLSNEIALNVVIPPVPQSPCVLPGITVLTDATGDSTSPEPGTDIISASVAQPYSSDGSQKMVFTIQTDPALSSAHPTGSAWYLAMRIANGPSYNYTGVRMEYLNPTTPSFYIYTPGANNSGGVDGRFVSSKTATTGNYNPTTGTITITVNASDLGLATGSVIAGFIAGSSQTTDPTEMVAGATEVWDSAPDSLSFTNTYTVVANGTCFPLQSVVSRKQHGSAGTFDIPLPLTGTPGLECRSGPISGAHTLVYTFTSDVTILGSASLAVSPAGNGAVSPGPNSNQVTVNLTNIPNAQHVSVTLNGIQDAASNILNGMVTPMDVLLADVNASGRVDSGDVFLAQQQNGQAITSSNFRADVNASGRIDSGDVFVTQQQNPSSLPPGTNGRAGKTAIKGLGENR